MALYDSAIGQSRRIGGSGSARERARRGKPHCGIALNKFVEDISRHPPRLDLPIGVEALCFPHLCSGAIALISDKLPEIMCFIPAMEREVRNWGEVP